MEADGQTGTVSFDGAYVTIKRVGLSRLSTARPDRHFRVTQISAVVLKPAGHLVSGAIEFLLPGGRETVVFSRRQATPFDELRRALEGGAALAAPPSVADELTKLARLVEQELLTREEFDREKSRLLGQS